MKIRIKGNSVRLRLTKTEVETFCREGFYTNRTQFPTSIFSYSLRSKKGISEMEASFENNEIILSMPIENLETWASSSIIGYNANLPLPNGEDLYLLVEKDFVCMDETVEDQSDNYPNPKAVN